MKARGEGKTVREKVGAAGGSARWGGVGYAAVAVSKALGYAKPTISWRVGQVGDVAVLVAGDLEPPFEFPVPVSHWHVLACFPEIPSNVATFRYRSARRRRSVPTADRTRTSASWQAWQARCP